MFRTVGFIRVRNNPQCFQSVYTKMQAVFDNCKTTCFWKRHVRRKPACEFTEKRKLNKGRFSLFVYQT